MYQFSSKSNLILALLLVFAGLAHVVVEYNHVYVKQPWYSEKLEAARIAEHAAAVIRERQLYNGIFLDTVNDPNKTTLIGQKYTLITTDRGDIDAKLTSVNPNFAAVVVDMLREAGVQEGDYVAISQTGSFPALNIAAYAAIKTLGLKPVIITSVGSSNWGANDPHFTWLDMEAVLRESSIFPYTSNAASMGGGRDRGRGLSPGGRDLIRKAIARNSIPPIEYDYLEESIAKRMEIYGRFQIKVFINIGGGVASLGDSVNGDIIPAGLTKFMAEKNYPAQGVILQMADKGVPVINFLNIKSIAQQYGIPLSPVPLPGPGDGEIFMQKRYNVSLASMAALSMLLLVGIVVYFDRKKHALGNAIVPILQKHEKSETSKEGVLL